MGRKRWDIRVVHQSIRCVVKDTDGAVFGDGDGWKRGLPISRIAHQDWTTDLNVSAIGCNPDDFELVPLSVVVEHSVDHVNGTVLRVDGQSMNTTLQKIHSSCGVSGLDRKSTRLNSS